MPIGRQKLFMPSAPGGIRSDVAVYDVPPGQWSAASNWLVRLGKSGPRPGYNTFSYSQVATADPLMGFNWKNTASGGNGGLVGHTATAAYHLPTGTDLTGTWAALDPTTSIRPRLAEYFSNGNYHTVRVSTGNAVDRWDGDLANDFVNATGAMAGVDLTVVEPYLIVGGVTDGSSPIDTIRWCDANNCDSWPAINALSFREVPGAVNAVRALNATSFAVYKPGGLWLCSLQAARTAFQKQFIGAIRGPLNPAAVVQAEGIHYWMAEDGVIRSFDGRTVRIVNSSVSNLAETYIPLVFWGYASGVYVNGPESELWFFAPYIAGSNTYAIALNLTTNTASFHVFPELFYAAITDNISSAAKFPNIILGNATGVAVTLAADTLTDNGTPIEWAFSSGWLPASELREETEISGITNYWKKTDDPLAVTTTLTVSNSLSDDETMVGAGTYDISAASNEHLLEFGDLRGKFCKITHSGQSVVQDLEYRGSAVIGWTRAQDRNNL